MGSDIIKVGDKVDIRILQQVEQGRKSGLRPTTYRSKVQDIMKNGDMEIGVPTEGGENVMVPSGVRLEFLFYTRTGIYRCIGHIKDRYIKERMYLLLVERKTPLEKFQRRQYYRFECLLDIYYYPVTKEEAQEIPLEELKELRKLGHKQEVPKSAVAVDISGGGLRFISDEPGERGDYVLMLIDLERQGTTYHLEVLGEILFCKRLENDLEIKKNIKNKYEYRTQFMIKPKEREKIIKYIFEQERKNRQKG